MPMAEIPDHIKGIIALYIKRLEENRIPVRQAILFGSCATETIPFRPEDFVFDDPFVREILETGTRLI